MRMYQLYVEQCKGKIPEKEVISHAVYRRLFNEKFNFSFKENILANFDRVATPTLNE
jgi:hypothetical protein